MALIPGSRLGPYEINAEIGAGGMGQVYRATDTNLKRTVAIKVLPDSVADDPERLARFRREAEVLAALNHPHIAQIYGLERSGGTTALVMEFVDGPTLADLIREKDGTPDLRFDVAEATVIARQLAEALEAAHEQNIIHRDLKPANIKVRPDGTVKVLDFGLAKAIDGGASPPAGNVHDAPSTATMTSPAMTAMGMILGTAAYMSPEQARGRPVDRRADIWAFGAILFEMLSGRRLFDGETVSDMLAAVLRQDVPWYALPPNTPPSIRRLLRRCLERDPRKRLSAIGDARLDLEEADGGEGTMAPDVRTSAPAGSARARWLTTIASAIAAAVVSAFVVTAWRPAAPSANAPVTRTTVLGPEGIPIYPDPAEIAISPDGKFILFSTGDRSDQTGVLWIRSLDALTVRRIEGTEGGRLAFWSPDSRRVGFFADLKLKTISIDGGRPDILCDAPSFRGGTWSPNGTIVFSPDTSSALMRVSANGGTPVPVTTLDASRKQTTHRFPSFLPDGEHFLYVALPAREGQFDIFVGSVSGGESQFLGRTESSPTYAAPGWLLFLRQGTLTAQRFDADRRMLIGEAQPLPDAPGGLFDPATMWTAGRAATASASGVMAYLANSVDRTHARWIDAAGRLGAEIALPAGNYRMVRISPDGRHAAIIRQVSSVEAGILLLDLERQTAIPITTGRGANSWPAWSSDSTRLAFSSDRDGVEDIFVKTIGTTAPETPFYRSAINFKQANSWSPDGQWFVFHQNDPDTLQNIYLLPASGQGTPRLIAGSSRRDVFADVSPDGRWMLYLSDEPGQYQLFVQRFPEPAARTTLTSTGALFARWRKDSRQIVYSAGDWSALFAMDVNGSGPAFRTSPPRSLMTLPKGVVWMDAMPDLQKFLVLLPETTAAPLSVTVVTNWTAAIR